MSAREFVEWQVYASIVPIADRRDEINTARIVAAIYEVNRNSKKRHQPYTANDFVHDWWGAQHRGRLVDELDIEEQRAQLALFARVFGGKLNGNA